MIHQLAELGIEPVARMMQRDVNFGGDAAGIAGQHDDAVAHQHRFLDIVRDHEDALDRHASLDPEVEKIGAQGLGGQHVERRKGLVHQQNIGVDDKRPRKADALAHAAGEFLRKGGFETVEPDQIDRFQRAPAGFVLADLPFARRPSSTLASTVSQGNSAKL